MSRLRNINPRLRFGKDDVITGSAVSSLDRVAQLMAGADLVISTTADENVESVINQVAVTVKVPVLYGRSLRRANMGRVFLVRPGEDACKACLAGYALAGREGKSVPPDWIDIPESAEDVLLHECGRPVIAGSAADLSFIAALIARLAIDFLEGHVGDSNHWIWSRPAAGDVDKRLGVSFSTFSGSVAPSPDCPICREPPVAEVLIDEKIRQYIVAETESSPDVETGGVLVGYLDENHRVTITRAIGPGPKAVRTARRFLRDAEFAQAEIDRAAQELGNRGVYVGEWHSHLEAAPEPSPTDVQSLSGIATAPNYLTSTPVMVIAGLDPRTKKVGTLRSWVFAAGGRFYRVRQSG
jgi:integrative and conjugative element protein (TIGR02256 family)